MEVTQLTPFLAFVATIRMSAVTAAESRRVADAMARILLLRPGGIRTEIGRRRCGATHVRVYPTIA